MNEIVVDNSSSLSVAGTGSSHTCTASTLNTVLTDICRQLLSLEQQNRLQVADIDRFAHQLKLVSDDKGVSVVDLYLELYFSATTEPSPTPPSRSSAKQVQNRSTSYPSFQKIFRKDLNKVAPVADVVNTSIAAPPAPAVKQDSLPTATTWKTGDSFYEETCLRQKRLIGKLEREKEEVANALQVQTLGFEVQLEALESEKEELKNKLQKQEAESMMKLEEETHKREVIIERQRTQTMKLEEQILLDQKTQGLCDLCNLQLAQVVDSQAGVEKLVQKLEETKQEAARSHMKLAQQIQRTETYEHKLEACQNEIIALKREKAELQEKIRADNQVENRIVELQETCSTQQVQIECLIMVNKELVEKLQETEEDATNILESVENQKSKIEDFESLWEQQRTQMESLQQHQAHLLKKLGKYNFDASIKIDEMCESMSDLSKDGALSKQNKVNTNPYIVCMSHGEASERLEMVYENDDTYEDSSTASFSTAERSLRTPMGYEDNGDNAKIEEYEAAWAQHKKQIESLQQDQEELLARLRASSSDATSKIVGLCESIEEEESHIVDHSKAIIEKQNQILRALQQDNQRISEQLQETETDTATQIKDLQEQLKKQTLKADSWESKFKEIEMNTETQIQELQEQLQTQSLKGDSWEKKFQRHQETIDQLNEERTTLLNDMDIMSHGEASERLEMVYENDDTYEDSSTASFSTAERSLRTPMGYEDNGDNAKIEEYEAAWAQHKKQIESLQQDQEELLARLRASSSDATSKIVGLCESIEEEESHIVDHSKAIIEKQNQILRALQQDNQRISEQLQETETDTATQIKDLQEQLKKQTLKADSWESKFKEIEMNTETQIQELQEQLQTQSLKGDSWEKKFQRHQETIDQLNEERTTLLNDMDMLKSQIEQTDGTLNEQRAAVASLQKENASFSQALEEEKLKLERILTGNEQHKEMMACLRRERDALEQLLNEHRAHTKEVEAICSLQRTTIDSLQDEKNTLTKRMLATEEEFRNHLIHNFSVHAQISELRNKISNAVEAVEEDKSTHNCDCGKDSKPDDIDSREISCQETEPGSFDTDDDGCHYGNGASGDGASEAGKSRTLLYPAKILRALSKSDADDRDVAKEKLVAEDVLRLMSFS
jgi:hypothetical protein